MIYIFTLVLAFCSIVYELLLGQILSAFLGNTVLRYSVTIGLYLFSMGVGAIIAEGRFVKHPIITLQRVEILLTLLGSLSMVMLHIIDWLTLPDLFLSLFAHSLIILIGVLTGFEIPLLIHARNLEKAGSDNIVLVSIFRGLYWHHCLCIRFLSASWLSHYSPSRGAAQRTCRRPADNTKK